MTVPKWVTPERQGYLVNLFIRSGGFCIFGHKPCEYSEHHYVSFIEGLIKDWIADDRADAQALWKAEQRALHSNGEIGGYGKQFDATARDVFFQRQPFYYIEGLGISGLTFKPFAKVRIASSFVALHVDIDKTIQGVSKNRKRKAVRYGRIPSDLFESIEYTVKQAVYHYLR